MENQEVIQSTKEDLDRARTFYQLFVEQNDKLDRKLFDFKVALTGFLGVILAIVFSNTESFSEYLQRTILVITTLAFGSLILEIWKEAEEKVSNVKEMESDAILANIRYHSALFPELRNYGAEAQRIHSQGVKILNAMKDGESSEEILKLLSKKISWKANLIWWGLISISIPVAFLLTR